LSKACIISETAKSIKLKISGYTRRDFKLNKRYYVLTTTAAIAITITNATNDIKVKLSGNV
jgi:hypothetical protein